MELDKIMKQKKQRIRKGLQALNSRDKVKDKVKVIRSSCDNATELSTEATRRHRDKENHLKPIKPFFLEMMNVDQTLEHTL